MRDGSSAGSTNVRPKARRSVLLVAQIAPPSTHSGARRVAGLTKYLARMGYAVTVLTSRAWGGDDIPGATRVVVTPDLLTTRLNWRRDDFMALERGRGASQELGVTFVTAGAMLGVTQREEKGSRELKLLTRNVLTPKRGLRSRHVHTLVLAML